MSATVGLVLGVIILGVVTFRLGHFFPAIWFFPKFLTILLFILPAIVVPIQAASLKLALHGVFREDVPFKGFLYSHVNYALCLRRDHDGGFHDEV
ncbi:MAG: hypothetical protein ACJ06V_03215 [Verrucomicrobiota bacterium]